MIKKLCVALLIILFAVPCFGKARWYNATSHTGGTAGTVDSINGQNLYDGDKCIVVTTTNTYFYTLDVDSAGTEDTTNYTIISPDSNAGDKRWILETVVYRVRTDVITLTAAQVEAVATPIELVAAQGAGTIIEFVSATLAVNYSGSGNWAEPSAPDELVIEYETSGVDVMAEMDATGFIDQTNDELRWVLPTEIPTQDLVASVNKGLFLHNSGGNYTDSDAVTSTLVVNITYRVHTTGL